MQVRRPPAACRPDAGRHVSADKQIAVRSGSNSTCNICFLSSIFSFLYRRGPARAFIDDAGVNFHAVFSQHQMRTARAAALFQQRHDGL